MVQNVTLLKRHGWIPIRMAAKIESYRRNGWTVSEIAYDADEQVSFKAEKEIDWRI